MARFMLAAARPATRTHLALEAELHVVRGELVAVVEGLAGPQEEGPGEAVGRELPPLGDAGTDAALLEIEADQRIVHDRLVDGVARPAFEIGSSVWAPSDSTAKTSVPFWSWALKRRAIAATTKATASAMAPRICGT
jgi:hypothetical protein